MTIHGLWKLIITKFDKLIAIIALVLSLLLGLYLLLIEQQPVYSIGCFFVVFVCAMYLVSRNRALSAVMTEKNKYPKLYLVLNISFVILLISSILSFYLRSDPYVRPISYFIFTSIMVVTVVIEILCCRLKGSRTYFTLLKIMIIAFSLRWTPVLLYTEVIGVDPWAHQMWVGDLLTSGSISSDAGTYTYMPMFHLLTAATSLITEVKYRFAVMLSAGSLQIICDILFIFLIGKKFANYKVALLAALLLSVASYHIQKSYWIIPNTMGATIAIMIVYVLLNIRHRFPLRATILWMVLAVTLILTHAVASMYICIFLFSSYVGFTLYKSLYGNKLDSPVTPGVFAFFAVMMFAYWLYISGLLEAFAIIVKNAIISPVGAYSPAILMEPSFISQAFAYLGLILFFSLAFYGLFYMISKASNRNSFAYAVGGAAICSIAAFALFGGKASLLESRWIYFSQILLVIPLALTIWLFSEALVNKLYKVAMPSLMVSAMAFFLIISPQVNIDNPTFYKVSRSAFIESELQAMHTVSEVWKGSVVGDFFSTDPFVFGLKYELDKNYMILDYSNIDPSLEKYQDKLVFIRRENLTEDTANKLHTSLTQRQFSKIYTSGTAFGYVNTGS